MGRNNLKVYFVMGAFSVLMLSCEYYLGVNQQPDFVGEDIEVGLNIFGILRPDSIGNYNKSFVYVQKIWPVLVMDSFKIIQNANVKIERIDGGNVLQEIDFPLVLSDTVFADTLYRSLESFSPKPGEKYRIVCSYEGLPDAIGETTIPLPPQILENSLVFDGRNVGFTLLADSLTSMVDIYGLKDEDSMLLTRMRTSNSDMQIDIEIPIDLQSFTLKIFSYDSNLSLYFGDANTSVNFNKYRSTISTLESGYGVFGAMNFTEIPVALTE